jgi:hypothetical protein
MKTAKRTTGNFPRPGRFSLYICAVMVLCFFNWVALNAQTVKNVNNFMSPVAVDLAEVDEPAIQLQDWMMHFDYGFLAVNKEIELDVEPWMLSFSHDYLAGTEESEIHLEPWMVSFEQRCLVVENEDEFPVENWMVSTCAWECPIRLLAGK